MSALGPLVHLLVLFVITVVALGMSIALLVGRRHPLRILISALTIAFFLLAISAALPLIGVLAGAWGVLVLLALVGTVVALARSRVADPRTAAADDAASVDRAARRRTRRRRRAVRRASRPSGIELGVSIVLLVAALTMGLIAG